MGDIASARSIMGVGGARRSCSRVQSLHREKSLKRRIRPSPIAKRATIFGMAITEIPS